MVNKHRVKLTANFERNLEQVDIFLLNAGAPQAFDTLLLELANTVIPNLESFPKIGRSFMAHPSRSVEVRNSLKTLKRKLTAIGKQAELHEYSMTNYLLLYANFDATVYLLSIRHHRQISFDLQSLWQ